MEELLFVLTFIPLSLIVANLVANKSDKKFLLVMVTGAWFTLAPLIALISAWMPFTGGGDDSDYFRLVEATHNNWGEVADLTHFVGVMEQPGYPWLLSIINVLIGSDLLVYKWVNLFFLIMLSLTWYRIGLLLESPSFARRMMLSVLLLTPLWFYVFFLLKDMSIALLQSLFLLGAVEIWREGRFKAMVGTFTVTFLLILFRVALVFQNVVVLLGALAFKVFARGRFQARLTSLFIGLIFLFWIQMLAMNPEALAFLGITSEQRVFGSVAMVEIASSLVETTEMNRALFPILYLFSETSGLTPQAWLLLDAAWLRGVLALPWIFLVVPFFILGMLWLLRPPTDIAPTNGLISRLRQSRLMVTPWISVFLFIASSIAISWIVGDSTRWRISDMPMIAAVAMAGWTYSKSATRRHLLIGWICGLSILSCLIFLVRS